MPIKLRCDECKKEFVVEENAYVCPACQATKVEILTGKEVLLDSLEGEN